jgi:uncharacterized protein (TIGR02300 family)
VAKPEWGKKRTCQSCGAAFYDLKRKTISCPKCGAAYDPNAPSKGKRPAAVAPAASVAAPRPKPVAATAVEASAIGNNVEPLADDEEDVEDARPTVAAAVKAKSAKKGDDKDEALIEDASDLGEDEDDIGEVKEHIDDGVGDKA